MSPWLQVVGNWIMRNGEISNGVHQLDMGLNHLSPCSWVFRWSSSTRHVYFFFTIFHHFSWGFHFFRTKTGSLIYELQPSTRLKCLTSRRFPVQPSSGGLSCGCSSPRQVHRNGWFLTKKGRNPSELRALKTVLLRIWPISVPCWVARKQASFS